MTGNRSKALRVAAISDIHLVHARNPTKRIIANIDLAFPDDSETAALDIIFIAGDVFQSQIQLADDDVIEIDFWIRRLLRLCVKNNIVLRVLEGTKSHDWYQSKRFETINELASIGADVRYIKTVSIEYIEPLDINVLYVPDELNPTTENIRELMAAKGLEQVDFACMHGQFEYQLTSKAPGFKHSSEDYLKMVKHYIFIGHIHQHVVHSRIVPPGSFDRLTHGDEKPKGHVRAVVWSDGERELRFIENTNAMVFKTVEVSGLELEEVYKCLEEICLKLPDRSRIRICAEYTHPIFNGMDVLVRMWPWISWDKELLKEGRSSDEKEMEYEEETGVGFSPIAITTENIRELLLQRLSGKADLSPTIFDLAAELIEELK